MVIRLQSAGDGPAPGSAAQIGLSAPENGDAVRAASNSFRLASLPVPRVGSSLTCEATSIEAREASHASTLEHAPASIAPQKSELAPLTPAMPMRAGSMTVQTLIDLYMGHYAGRDTTRLQRLTWWAGQLGPIALQDVSDDHVHAALEALGNQHGRYFAGNDADGKAILKAKAKPRSPATINRYNAAIGAVFTWAIKRRIAPKAWTHPCHSVERKPEDNQQTRYLSDAERARLLEACKLSPWPRMYLIVMLGLTTGARRGELLGLRWIDIDIGRAVAHVGRSKNGDPKVLPLVPTVIEELKKFSGAPGALVFLSRRRPDLPYSFESRWQATLRQAKIRSFRFHDLRHTCASMLAQNGATLLEIGELLGHRQLQVTKRYSHLATSHKAALVNRVLGGIQ